MLDVRRRHLITLLGGAAAWPLAVRAQQPAMPVIGYLSGRTADSDAPYRIAFHRGLKGIGFIEGQNVAIEYRWAEYQYNRLPELAAELVRRKTGIIFATPLQSGLAAKEATATIPIVFAVGSDPIKFGLVSSFNRPGGNITGVSWLGGPTLAAKRLELLHELVPTATVVAVLANPTSPNTEAETKELREAARAHGLQLQIFSATTDRDIDSAFASLVSQRVGALVVATDALLNAQYDQLAALTGRNAVPAIHQLREFATAGGLMSYGASIAEASRLAGIYVGRILKGEKPADLPVQQAVKVELIINMKTAKALGITVPLPLSGLADEVIE
jgi:putative tryptophan/tyrosine transport system substrate-binding protein